MAISPQAGKPVDRTALVDVDALLAAYYDTTPDPADPAQRVAFGTSGHRGSSFRGAFNEAHILAITEAICRYRTDRGYDGPLFLARDTHALSEPATRTALSVLVANGVDVRVDAADGYTPTPALSHAIITANRGADGQHRLADGIVVTPSHNPPDDGGFKYNPPHGGPADTDVTRWIQDEANRILEGSGGKGTAGLNRVSDTDARVGSTPYDFLRIYVADLESVIDMGAIAGSGLRIGVDPMGGASVAYWSEIGDRYDLDLTVTNDRVDPQFGFMTADWDGKIRMDPSSPYAMAGLVELRDEFDIALGNDADADRHGIVTPAAGLLNPNHFLAAAIGYLFGGARGWGSDVAIGKTLVSSSMIDRVAADLGRRLVEVPVGFKWFVEGLVDGSLGFGGEESAGASFLRRDGTVWTTDKDGIIADLLACEMTARTGRDPGEAYRELTERFGISPAYRRIDAPASPAEKAALARLTPSAVTASSLAGDPITAVLTEAPGNGASIGGLKVVTEERLVRRTPIRNRERVQDLCRELHRRGSPGSPDRGSPDRRRDRTRRRLGLTAGWHTAVTGVRTDVGRALASWCDGRPIEPYRRIPMSDDLREREPKRDQADFPPEEGIRGDNAGTGAGVLGPAPAGGDPEKLAEGPAGDPDPPSGMATPAGGGYGVGSDRPSSGGSGEGQTPAGDDAQTDWLRDASGGAPSSASDD